MTNKIRALCLFAFLSQAVTSTCFAAGDVELIAKIEPYNQAFTVIVEAENAGITDAGGYYTSAVVEGALQEIGADLAGITPRSAAQTKTANYTITGSDDTIIGDTSGGSFTITLPTAVGVTKVFTVKRSGANELTVDTTSSQTIDGSLTIILAEDNTSLNFESDGANWRIT